MILVTRNEVDVIREKAKGAHIAIVNRGHKNKHYYAEESFAVKRILSEIRGVDLLQQNNVQRNRGSRKGVRK